MKKLVALILTVILAVGAIFMVGCGNGNNGGDQTANSGNGGSSSTGSDQIQQVTTYPGVRSVRLSMGAMSETEATTTSTGEQTEAYSERTIIATILPTSALQQVDFTMTWQSDGTSEGIDEYLTLTQETDGSPKAVVRCTKDFSAKGAILITATARAGGLSDTLTATFEGVTRDFVFNWAVSSDYPSPVSMSSGKRGDYQMCNGGSGFSMYYWITGVDFYGDPVVPVVDSSDLEILGSDTYVYVRSTIQGLTDHETVLRIKLSEFAEGIFTEVDCGTKYFSEFGEKKAWLGMLFNAGFFDGCGEAVSVASGGAFGSSFLAVKGFNDSIVASQYYTVVDYEQAIANSTIDDAIIGEYLGSELLAMSEQALSEAYYEIRLTDGYSKLTKSFRLWGRLPATSVDTGSDIIF